MESLLCAVLDVIGDAPYGRTFDEVMERIVGPDFQKSMRQVVGGRPSTPSSAMSALGIRAVPTDDECVGNHARYAWGNDLCEEELASRLQRELPPAPAATALSCALLAVLYSKWRGRTGDPVYVDVATKMSGDFWMSHTFSILDEWLKPETTWQSALRPLVRRLVVDRHDTVMYAKRRLDSCWLAWSGNRLVKDQDYQPYRRSSRQTNAIRIMTDLCLLKHDRDGGLVPTSEGERLLQSILEEHR